MPSGDQLWRDDQREQQQRESAKAHVGLTTLVLGASSKGSATLACIRQSAVRQILRVLSSDCRRARSARSRKLANEATHLRSEVLADRIKDDTLDESHVTIEATNES